MDPDDPLGVDELVKARRDWDAQIAADQQRWDEIAPRPPVEQIEQNQPAELDDEPPAATAGEEDHSNPWRYAGEDADPPADTGRPPDAD